MGSEEYPHDFSPELKTETAGPGGRGKSITRVGTGGGDDGRSNFGRGAWTHIVIYAYSIALCFEGEEAIDAMGLRTPSIVKELLFSGIFQI
jgi:hypothetical protein